MALAHFDWEKDDALYTCRHLSLKIHYVEFKDYCTLLLGLIFNFWRNCIFDINVYDPLYVIAANFN